MFKRGDDQTEDVSIKSRDEKNMKTLRTIVCLAVLATGADAQISVTRSEVLQLSRSRQWSHPQFSPSGASVFYTDSDGNGIWEYSHRARTAWRITSDARSGFSFSVSEDGRSLVYRRTLQDRLERKQS